MNKFSYILMQLLAVALSTLPVAAETYERIERRNQWNAGRNITGLLRDTVTISYAELYVNSQQGDYRNFSDASSLMSAGAHAHTISHKDRISMIGEFSFDHMQGNDMCGSMLISPNQYPVDILEFTPGKKTLQSYSAMGGISTEINDRLSIGVKGEFASHNYAKFKDLRHHNYRMELSVAPSISYKIGEVTAGLSYIFARNNETVRAKQIGSATSAYYAFFDKGLMMGTTQIWNGTGIHLQESGIDGFPIKENFNGAAAQLNWKGFYGDFEYMKGCGDIGEKLTYWFKFPSQRYTSRLGFSKLNGNKLHSFMVEVQYSELENNENVLGKVSENGVTTTVIYGSNKIFYSEQLSIMPRYEIMVLDGADIEIGANYHKAYSRSTQMYPYVDQLTTECYQGYVKGMIPVSNFEIGACVLASSGDVDDSNYKITDDIAAGDKPAQMADYYNIENEYLTATTLTASLSLRYNHRSSCYAQLESIYTKALKLKYIKGTNRLGCTLRVGYKF